MKILGIDPGTYRTGFGSIEVNKSVLKPIGYGVITVSKSLAFSKRLRQIFEEICKIIEEYSPKIIALEDIFFGKNFSSAVKIGEVRGITILAATNYNIDVFEYSPATVKKSITGYGNADKSQIQKMVLNLLNLKELPTKDAADALAVAICHSHTLKGRVIDNIL